MTNELIEASAGTGKTQALGQRLIDLLREGIKPQEIVALTFSRAAAGEIFERFVSLLAGEVEEKAKARGEGEEKAKARGEGEGEDEAKARGEGEVRSSSSDSHATRMSRPLCDATTSSLSVATPKGDATFLSRENKNSDHHCSPPPLLSTSPKPPLLSTSPKPPHLASSPAALLREVIAAQHLSQIGTLDSFLMRIVRAFPLELGLVGDLEMMDDYAAASERARISFSILRRTDAKLKRAFVDAFSLAMNREDVRSFVDSYRSFIKDWHERMTAQPEASAWGDPMAIWGRDPAFAHVTARELAAAADQIDATFPGNDKWHEFAEWVRTFRGRFGTPKGLAKKLLGADDVFDGDAYQLTFYKKAYVLSREETLVVRDALLCVCGYVVRMKLELARGVHRLIAAFETEYNQRVRQTGKLVFADVPRLLASLPEEKRLALEFRTDSHIRAWALDEFQDTSREQWKALSNLIDEAKQSDGEKSLFIVGDTKQAIYGWRNGDVSIFRRERDSGAYKPGHLIKTYRSGPAIVEAVNRVFARGRIRDEFPAWECPEHETAKPNLTGFVRTMEAAGRSMEDFVEPVLAALKATLGEKSGDPRRREVSAAILVRGNKFGAFLADRLKAAGIEGVVWEGESAILDTPALSGFLDLVQLADHPGDMLTYRHFALTPVAKAKYPDGLPDAASVSREMALAFTTRGLVRTFREIRALLPEDPQIAWSAFTEERFTDMLRAAAEFELGLTAGSRLADFSGYLQSKTKRTVAEAGKIKVMTIHRSKGLGFDYTVLPLYEYESLNAEPDGPLVGDGWILPDPGAKVAKIIGGLEAAYRLRKDRAEQEALCTYYVAMTRAKRGMTIIMQPQGTSLKFSDLVRSAELGDLANPDVMLTSPFVRAVSHGPAVCPAGREDTARTNCHPPRKPRTTIRRRLPSLQFQSGMSAGLLFTGNEGRRAAMDRGTALHAEMEKVEFTTPDRTAAALGGSALSLPKPEGFVELWRERAFEVFADGEWISGRFDRVTFFNTSEGLSAEIIDFKSSLAHPERYDGQLAAYRRAVAALTGIPPERITARLVALT